MGDESPDLNIVKGPSGVKPEVKKREAVVRRADRRYLWDVIGSATHIAQSGLVSNERRLAASAHNTANLATDRFASLRAAAAERAGGGTEVRVDRVELSETDARAPEPASPRNNVDTVRETVNRISALRSFEANARVVRVQDQLSRGLLDVTA